MELMLARSPEEVELAAEISSKHAPEDRVCWHFMSEADLSSDDEAHTAYYEATQRAFGNRDDCSLELSGLGSFEVWDPRLPAMEWLRQRAGQLARISHSFGARLEGWSYEPFGYPEKCIPQAFGTEDEEEPDAQTN